MALPSAGQQPSWIMHPRLMSPSSSRLRPTVSEHPLGRHPNSSSLLDHIGRTPLLRIRNLGREFVGVDIYAKAEWFNPGGSVKDRAALQILRDAEEAGQLTPDKTILDATSGNTGIAYAMIGSILGYRVELVMPAHASQERKKIVTAYGAKLTLTDPHEGSDGAILEARRLYALHPERYFYADQYNNPSNWRAHYLTTGPEILEQTQGRVTHLVAGLGTGGTAMGAGRCLKEYNPSIQIIGVQPRDAWHGIEGLKHMETAILPGIYDESFLDRKVGVGTEEAYDMVRRLALEEGLLVGQSSGAAMRAALDLAAEIERGLIVVIFPDGGDRYLSTRLWD